MRAIAGHYARAHGSQSDLGSQAAGYTVRLRGGVAQLGERRVRNAKVGSSILLLSTTDHLSA